MLKHMLKLSAGLHPPGCCVRASWTQKRHCDTPRAAGSMGVPLAPSSLGQRALEAEIQGFH